MQYTDLPYSRLEQLWKGIVKIDYSLINKVTDGDVYHNYTIFTINDSKHKLKDNAQFDNNDGRGDFPNDISMFVRGEELLERMQCTVVKGYNDAINNKPLQKARNSQCLMCKGFILEPVTGTETDNVNACLALLQLDNEDGTKLNFNQLGIFAFASGSQTSNITLRDPRRSMTAVFVASKDKPLIVYATAKKEIRKFICDDRGIKIIQELIENKKEEEDTRSSPMTSEKALSILKGRLAKGEITTEDYKNLKRIILEDDKYSSNWV